jgi:hypothetical protein
MIMIGLILGALGIGFFCWLLFTLAVYALPFPRASRQASPRSTAVPA